MRSADLRIPLILFLGLSLLDASPAGAEERPLRAATADLMPGGMLLDRAVDLAGSEALDGSGDSPSIDPTRFRQLVHQLHRSAAVPLAWPSAAELRARGIAASAGTLPIALVDVEVSRLRLDALGDGSLRWEGRRLVATGAGDPFRHGRVFAAAGLIGATARGGDLTLRLDREHMLGDSNAETLQLELDADDGLGFRALELDTAFPLRYASTGTKTLSLRATAGDGFLRHARFDLRVDALEAPPLDAIWTLTASTPYGGAAASGEAFVYLAPGNTQLSNPVIAVEGLDLDNAMNWEELYLLLNQENLLEDLRAEGYDTVVLNFDDSTDYIQRNAYLLIELIHRVQAELADPNQSIAIVGASMGGLVARYALAAMEDAGESHRTRCFVSMDSPQGGANIPLGIQYWLDFFDIESDEAGHLLGRLDRPASRQMLLYHHSSPPSANPSSDPLRATLLAELANLGDYPAEPYLVAVANGSGQMANQGFAPAAQIIYYEYESLLVDIIGNVWALPDFVPGQILHGEIDRIWPLDDDALSVSVTGTWAYDGAPGGRRSSMTEMDEVSAPYGDIVALHPAHCFIPTTSALDLNVTDPFFDFTSVGDLLALTPFDEIHYPAGNQEHVLVTPENKPWLIEAVTRSATAAPPGSAPALALLLPCHPNPFNPATRVVFELALAGDVELRVVDAMGRRQRLLVAGAFAAGRHELDWDGRDDGGRELASGVYLLSLAQGEQRAAQRLVLLR